MRKLKNVGQMPTYYAAVCLEQCNPNPHQDLWLFELKIGTPVTAVLENANSNFEFCVVSIRTVNSTDKRRLVTACSWTYRVHS